MLLLLFSRVTARDVLSLRSFALFIEQLGQWISQNQNIKGISTTGGEQKLALFAENILTFSSNLYPY